MDQDPPNLPLDFVDLVAAFANAEVRYLIIGGYAEGYHDRPRTTKTGTRPDRRPKARTRLAATVVGPAGGGRRVRLNAGVGTGQVDERQSRTTKP